MMNARELAQLALQVLKLLEKHGPYEIGEVLHIATALAAVEIARLNRPQPVRDE